MYVCSSLIQWIGMTSQATETELLWHRVIPFTEASPSAHGNDGLLPQQPPLLHFRTHIPPHKGEVKGHRAPLTMSRPRLTRPPPPRPSELLPRGTFLRAPLRPTAIMGWLFPTCVNCSVFKNTHSRAPEGCESIPRLSCTNLAMIPLECR